MWAVKKGALGRVVRHYLMVFVTYGSNGDGWKTLENLGGWFAIEIAICSSEAATCNTPTFLVWPIRNLWLRALLRKQGEIKAALVLTRLPHILSPWRNLRCNWSRVTSLPLVWILPIAVKNWYQLASKTD